LGQPFAFSAGMSSRSPSHFAQSSPWKFFGATVCFIWLGCSLPRDADGTLDRVKNGVIRIGVAPNGPWVGLSGGQLSGYEGTIAAELAKQLNASLQVHPGAESTLLEQLHERKLDLVIGGLTADSPWKQQVAMTTPYHRDKGGKDHVLALAPGENKWLVRVDRYIHDNEQRLKAIPE
jgi:polar amino acid transport system substrate-binding protein